MSSRNNLPKWVYEALPIINILTGIILVANVAVFIPIVIGLIQLLIGVIIVTTRIDYRIHHRHIEEEGETKE